MRSSRGLLTVLTAAVLLVACNDRAADTDAESLRAELDEARAEVAELTAERDELATELEALRDDEADTPQDPADLHSDAGLVDQLRVYFADDDAPEDWELGPGEWADAEVPDGFAEADEPDYDSPGELATALAQQHEGAGLGQDLWEVTARVLIEDPDAGTATAAVLSWGLADDAVAGSTLRLELAEQDAGWYVDAVEERPYCRRAVTDEGLCL